MRELELDKRIDIDGFLEARDSLDFMRSIADIAHPCRALDRLKFLIEVLDEHVNALEPDSAFLSAIKPTLIELLSERADGIEVIIKDEQITELIGGVDAFVLHYYSDDFVTLQELIYKFMREKGIDKPSDVWKPVGLGRRAFHKLTTNYNTREAQAPKLSLLQLSVGLRLTLEETSELLENQCHSLTRAKSDLIFVYFALRRRSPRDERDFTLSSKREADLIRERLYNEGITLPQIYE